MVVVAARQIFQCAATWTTALARYIVTDAFSALLSSCMSSKKKLRKTKDKPNIRDRLIGERIRLRRQVMGLSLQVLADRLGLSFQLLHRYETGSVRVSASLLMDFCSALKATPEFFFQDFDGGANPDRMTRIRRGACGQTDRTVWHLQREAGALVRSFKKITDPAARKAILGIARKCAKSGLMTT